MKRVHLSILAWIFWVCAVSPAPAQEVLNQKRPASENGIVEILNVNGAVQVVGWKQNEVGVEGTLGEGAKKLEFSGNDHRTTVHVVTPKGQHPVGNSYLKVHVPDNSQVEVGTINADIDVSGVSGMLFLQSVTGNIRIKGKPKEVEAKSMRGKVDISVAKARVKATSAGGRVTLRETSGEAEVSTISGDIVVEGGKYERGRFKTVSGDVRFEGSLDRNGVFEFLSHSGNIELLLPDAVAADFQVSTYSGQITNEFQPKPAAKPPLQRIPREQLTFSTGLLPHSEAFTSKSLQPASGEAGPARVTVSSFSGNVRLERR